MPSSSMDAGNRKGPHPNPGWVEAAADISPIPPPQLANVVQRAPYSAHTTIPPYCSVSTLLQAVHPSVVVTSKVSNSLVPQTLRASPSSCDVEEEAVFQICCGYSNYVVPVVDMFRSSDYGVQQMVALVRRLDVQIIHLSFIRGQSVCSGEFSFV